jgi:hypothetical protein
MEGGIGLDQLEEVVLGACSGQDEWPARIAAGIYAGVDFAVAHPEVAEASCSEVAEADIGVPHERLIRLFTGLLKCLVPTDVRRPGVTEMALVGGVVSLVDDHLRHGRVDCLSELRPDFVLLVLLPYLGFAEAKRWAELVDSRR